VNAARAWIAGLLGLSGALGGAPWSLAQDGYERRHPVEAVLLPADLAIAPGGSATVLVRLDHDPGWQTFWTNPGAGEATRAQWSPPGDWRIEPGPWPTPRLVYDEAGEVFGYGYSDRLDLPFRLSAPDHARLGERASLPVALSWLACRQGACVEADAQLRLDVHVERSPTAGEGARRLPEPSTPETSSGWRFQADIADDELHLSVAAPEPIDPLYFFPSDPLIWHADPQVTESASPTQHRVRVRLDPFFQGDRSTLSGVLAYHDADGTYQGVRVQAQLGDGLDNAGAILPSTPVAAGGAFWRAVLFAFLGGLVLNVMPCVLPVLSMKVIALTRARHASSRAMRIDGWAYAAGVVTSFALIGLAIVAARGVIPAAQWGVQLQNPILVLALALLMTAVALNLLGVFSVGASLQSMAGAVQTGEGSGGAFITGVLAVLVAAPCTAPFMASALGYALIAPPASALAVFLALGVGLASPYLAITHVRMARCLIPAPGPWSQTLQRVLAFPMLAAAIWLLWVLGAQTGHDGMAVGLLACLALAGGAMALCRGGRSGMAVGAALTALALSSLGMIDRLSPTVVAADETRPIQPVHFSYTALEAALEAEQSVFLYFTADWCITCKVNEQTAIYQPRTLAHFDAENIVLMVGDWTREDPEISRMIADYGRAGVPLYLYFPAGSGLSDGDILPQVLSASLIITRTGG